MTAVTITGTAAIEGDTAGSYHATGWLDEAECFERMAEELPDDGVHITVGHHGPRVGELVYGEINGAGQVNVVGVLHDDEILAITQPVYFSPELVTIGPKGAMRSRHVADLAGIRALALVFSPAGHGLQPVHARPGDVRSSADRTTWPLDWKADGLLTRALDALGRTSRVTRLERQADTTHGPEGWITYDGRPARSAPTGRASGTVLGVR